MTDLRGARIAVAGAGAIGSVTALMLAHNGAQVLLADPAALGDNASGVAAGMLAPALEAALDEPASGHFALLRAARDEWSPFARLLGREEAIDRSGALWLGDPEACARRLTQLRALGAEAEPVTAAQAMALSPGLRTWDGGLFTAEDWRIDPQPLLAALRRGFLAAGGRVVGAAATGLSGGAVTLQGGEAWPADWIVFAGGHPSTSDLAPELAVLSPIKGQIVRFEAGARPSAGPTVRTTQVYVAPSASGTAAGATMEPGLLDRHNDPAVTERLRSAAISLFGGLATADFQAQAGVRSATPDALPLVGQSAQPGVLLATGARRNGWLLAPMIGRMICAYAAGQAPGPWADGLRPDRFQV